MVKWKKDRCYMQIGRKIKQWYYKWMYPVKKAELLFGDKHLILNNLRNRVLNSSLGKLQLSDATLHDNGKYVNYGVCTSAYYIEICCDNGIEICDEHQYVFDFDVYSIQELVHYLHCWIKLIKESKHD